MIQNMIAKGAGGGGADLSWLAASTPALNVQNFFYALINGNVEHGEFTRTETQQAFTTLFTMTQFSDANPPRGFLFIDKNYVAGTYPSTNSEAVAFLWMDKAFMNAATQQVEGNNYTAFKHFVGQTGTSGNNMIATAVLKLDGSSETWRAKYQINGHDFQIYDAYTNNDRYVLFRRYRTYIWIAY